MNKFFLACILILSLIAIRCSIVDPFFPCTAIRIQTSFIDSVYRDVTGDSLNPIIKFHKDSIRYKIEGRNINTGILIPSIIDTLNRNSFSTEEFNVQSFKTTDVISVIYYLNSTTSDTLTLTTDQERSIYKVYYKQKNIEQFGGDFCSGLIFVVR